MSGNYWNRVTTNRVARRRVLRSGAALSVGAAALALIGCGDDDQAPSSTTAPGSTTAPAATLAPAAATSTPGGTTTTQGEYTPSEGTPRPGGKLTFRYGTSANFNPVSNWNEGTNLGGDHVYDRPLTSREDERRFVLEAMESLELPDDLTVAMKLVPGQTFHDFAPVNGRPLVAQDVVASQDYVSNLPDAFDRTFQNDFLDFAEAPDDNTVTYHLLKPNAYLFSQNMLGSGTGQPIMPPETYDTLDEGQQIGSGPYFLADATLNANFLYKKHPGFRLASKGLPYIDEREVLFIPDSVATEAAFRGKQIDLMRFPTVTQTQNIVADLADDIHLIEFLSFGCYFWHMNMERGFPWETDVRVREAFSRLTNRQQMIDLALDGLGEIPSGILPSGLRKYQLPAADVADFQREDVAEAKKLLAAANFDLDREWDCMGNSPGSTNDQTSLIWQQQLLRGDIKINISNVTGVAQLFERWTDNSWEVMHQVSPGTDTPGQALRNQHTDGWSDTYRRFGVHDAEVDRLIEESEAAIDPEENLRLVTECQKLCMALWTPSPMLLTEIRSRILHDRVQNYEVTQVSPSYRHDLWLKDA